MMDWHWILTPLAGVALVNASINALTWRRGAPKLREARVSALIPARNEAQNIARCVVALAACPEVTEIVVCDDGSTDGTDQILRDLQKEYPQLRVIQGASLPNGWIGKPHACHQLGQAAREDTLLFVDADTRLEPDGVARLVGLSQRGDAGVVTAAPRQETGSFAERLMLPLLHLTYMAWLPLRLVDLSQNPRFLAANGQVICFTRAAYEAIGGYAAVRREVVDDMAICRMAKIAGQKVIFADGHAIATCRMYRSADEIRKGFAKNLYEGLGGNPLALLLVIGVYGLAFVAPYVGLAAASLGASTWLLPSLVGVGLNLALRGLLAVRQGHTALSVLLHPVGVAALLSIGLNSFWWNMRGRIEWSGRAYAPRSQR